MAYSHPDESPIDLERLWQRMPQWLQRFLPIGGGQHDDHHGKALFGFVVFLLSESMIFVSFFTAYIVLRLSNSPWLPPGIKGPELTPEVMINSAVLVSSSFVIYFAERALKRGRPNQFRLLWLTTSAMGAYFLYGELREWMGLDIKLTTGLVGGTFYLLTGFHGLHVLTGILLQLLMLGRSFRPHNYDDGHFGLTAVSLFWHFVDVIWLVLFSLLYLW
jgi:cytochrome c oxidase subunit III